jgi:hypothetical protein
MHGFETLTLAPFDRRLIDTLLLTRTNSPGSTPIMPACCRDRPDGRRRDAEMAGGSDRAARLISADKLPQHDQHRCAGQEHRHHAAAQRQQRRDASARFGRPGHSTAPARPASSAPRRARRSGRLDARMDALETRQHEMAADAREIGQRPPGEDDPDVALIGRLRRALTAVARDRGEQDTRRAPIETCQGEPTYL